MESRINPPLEEPERPKRNNAWIYIAIIILLLATNIYLFLQKKSNTRDNLLISEQLQQTTSEKEVLQNEYDAALARLDQLTSQNAALKNHVDSQSSELQHIKDHIRNILSKSNVTQTELKEARVLIGSLNKKISDYAQQIADLKQQNSTLTEQRDSVTTANTGLKQANEGLQKKVAVAKILHASNIRLLPIILRKGGRKESYTEKARKVDLLRIIFDVDENLLAESGTKEFDIRIISPEGTLLSNTALGSGSFIDSKGKTQYYSLSKTVQLTSGMPLQDIDVDWRQAASYEKGSYIVEIYYEGHLIGQGTTTLR